jgi:hypothetical protein
VQGLVLRLERSVSRVFALKSLFDAVIGGGAAT